MRPDVTPLTIDKQQARRAFERAASAYDEVAVLQRETAQRMLERLDYIRHEPAVILDVGAGTGEATLALSRRFKPARTIALDFALPMLQRARKRGSWLRRLRCVCGDAERLPLADRSVDLIFSNATLQWCNDLEGTFREFLRVLRPDGLLMFSTFGPDTLKELRA
ncbi:MAG: methyltransferase domain-containing protein, partial [Chromatiales bacterium]